VLSLVLPVPMIALLVLTRQRSVMGAAVNRRLTSAVGTLAAGVVLLLNGLLLLQASGLSSTHLAPMLGNPLALAAALAMALILVLLITRWSGITLRPLESATGASMALTLVEQVQGGDIIPRGSPASWSPKMILPGGIDTPEDPLTGGVTVALPADWLDTIGLQVSPPPGASGAHRFHIVGTVDGRPVGQNTIVVTAGSGASSIPSPTRIAVVASVKLRAGEGVGKDTS